MIRELKINNLAIIKDMELEFAEKFSSLTGETGAGKSIILDGLALITGARSNTANIRQGADKLSVESVIEVNNELKEKILNKYEDIEIDDNEIIIKREIYNDGKTKININGQRVTLGTLSNVMELVIDIVGQHENQYLLNKKYHKELLDAFINTKEYDLKNIVENIKKIDNEIESLEEEKKSIIDKKDYYEFIIKEISQFELYDGIDEELEKEYKLAFNTGRINDSLIKVSSILDDIIFPNLKDCIRSLNNLTEFSNIGELKENLEQAREILQETSMEIEIDDNEYDIEEISNKLSHINKLKTKYKDNILDLILYKKELEEKLEKLFYSDDDVKKLKDKRKKYISDYLENAKNLSEKRKQKAKEIEKSICDELLELNMKEADFKIKFAQKDGFFYDGIDDIEFLIKTNKGQDYSRLDKIASGGEVSRIMLALKIVFSKVDNLSSLIFDEIDAGISGETVKLVAKKLKKLSENTQVICVTHSPNIAAMSQEQFLIYKNSIGEETHTNIKKLSYEERIDEISRIIAGENANNNLKDYVREMMKGKDD